MLNRRKARDYLRTFLGVLLLLISILAFFSAFYYYEFHMIFWFCYTAVFIMSLGILLKKTYIIKSQLYILAIPDLLWSLDFIYYLINGKSIFGLIDYLFANGDIIPKIVTMQHLIVVPIMFYSLILFSGKIERSWLISILQVTIVYLLTRIFTNPESNINCAFKVCGNFSPNFGVFYPVIWFAVAFLMIYVSRSVFIKSHTFFRKHFDL